MKKCNNCGAKVTDDSLYCQKCGSKIEETISVNDYTSNDPYHSVNEEEAVEAERVGVEENDGSIKKDEESKSDAAFSASSGNVDHVFAILSLVFGALGGLLSIVFGVLTLTSPTASKDDKKKAYIGLGLCACWFVIILILIFASFLQ